MTRRPNKMPKQTLMYAVLHTVLMSVAHKTPHAGLSFTLNCQVTVLGKAASPWVIAGFESLP